MFHLVIFSLLFAGAYSEEVTICGFPEGTQKCELTNLTCIDALANAARELFISDEAANYVLTRLDPLDLDTFTVDFNQFRITFVNTTITGGANSPGFHNGTTRPGVSVESWFWHTGNLVAKQLLVVDTATGETESAVGDINIAFSEILTNSLITLTPLQRCDGNIYFDFAYEVLYVSNSGSIKGLDVFKPMSLKDTQEELSEALRAAIGKNVWGTLLNDFRYIHAIKPANELWIGVEDLV